VVRTVGVTTRLDGSELDRTAPAADLAASISWHGTSAA
jgi:hypothetical protein